MKRVMCVYLPKWPLQRLWHERPELQGKPVVLVDARAARGPKVLLCSPEAIQCGIRPDMPVAEAVAIGQNLCIEENDPQQNLRSLEQLLEWAERFSPIVGLEEGPAPQSLLLDITGCASCFHGEDQLLQRAVRELETRFLRRNRVSGPGWTTRIAIADTIGAAWALAHYGHIPCLVPAGQAEQYLYPLPVAALRLPTDTLELLDKLGLERIEQLTVLPRASLPTRFGPILLQRLDQALGRLPETFQSRRFMPPLEAEYPFEPHTDRREALHYALDDLTERIAEMLRRRHWGARQIECWLYHEAAPPIRVEINLFRLSYSSQYLLMLLHTQFERVQLAEPVCAMRLNVSAAEPLTDHQAELFETHSSHSLDGLSTLIDRLSSRLGHEAVTRAALVSDAQPEYACRFEPLIHQPDARARASRSRPASPSLALRAGFLRPLRLWPKPIVIQVVSVVPEGPPVRFRWGGVDYRVSRAWGPERIETGWWRHQDVHRDYYVVVTHLGNRFWLFRRRDDGHWFLHGCFD